jgi:peptidoglycan/LPS O-acetylase OafA/YrhL
MACSVTARQDDTPLAQHFTPDNRRIPALDGLRGVLALLIALYHVALGFGMLWLNIFGLLIVMCFFVMSGFVLARAYDGNALVFVLRRIVRLWPLYGACMVFGYTELGRLPPISVMLWWPIPPFGTLPLVDRQSWSLYYEGWATFVFPALFWVAHRSRLASAGLTIAVASLGVLDFRWFLASMFVLGVTAARYEITFPARVPAAALWLGKVSYTLYLVQAFVIEAGNRLGGAWGGVASLPVLLVVSEIVWRAIERPSLRWSRRVGTWMVGVKKEAILF